jgi:hypothetical protein
MMTLFTRLYLFTRSAVFILLGLSAALAALPMPVWAADNHGWHVLSLSAKSEHAGSKVWSGHFTAPNRRHYDASDFYAPRNQPFSLKAIFAKPDTGGVTWLLPIALDTGHRAQLYQAAPLFSLGMGAAIALPGRAMVSVRAENMLRLGGGVSEQPCYDRFRRQFHCGTGMAWLDYQKRGEDRRNMAALPALKIKFVKRFSF